MGTTYINCRTKQEIKQFILTEIGDAAIDHGGSANQFYVLQRTSSGQHVIVLYLLKLSQGAWGYKDMDESMHPYYYDCPLRLLDKASPPPNDQAAEWRTLVRREARARRSLDGYLRKLRPGDHVKLTHGPVLRVCSVRPLRGTGPDGQLYRIPRSMIVVP